MQPAIPYALLKEDVGYSDTRLKKKDIEYPETDGEPMAESDFQRKPLTYLVESLALHFQNQKQTYVSGNLLIYYEKKNPKASVAPDVFVVFGVPKQDRRTYKIWEEGKSPDVAIEITSRTTRKVDEKKKPKLYRKLGVREYFQYDPTGDYLQPALRGRMLNEKGRYQKMRAEKLTDGTLSITSPLLGLQLHLQENRLRVFDPKSQQYLLTYSEEVKARQLAEKQVLRVQQEKEWVQQEKELAQQQAEQERQQKESAQQLAKKMAEKLRAMGINPDDIMR
jgi:Uma2 family endonuclease